MDEQRSRIHYWGEAFKEMGILISIFAPMYIRFDLKETGSALYWDGGPWLLGGIIVVLLGIELERRV
jgi:hypothetical protein